MTAKLIVFISGNGSNLQALIDATTTSSGAALLDAQISLVVSNRRNAYGIERAEKAGIPTLTMLLKDHKAKGLSRLQYDLDLVQAIKARLGGNIDSVDVVVLAGFMHILSKEFINSFPENTIINLHPALPGCFDGAKAIERAFEAFEKGDILETGVMIHRCIPEVDRGEVIVQETCPMFKTDTLSDLETRIHEIEHKLIVQGTELAILLKRAP